MNFALPALANDQNQSSASAASFNINAGLNDAWVSVDAPFQGLFFTVFPDLKLFFLSWFTFDSVSPNAGISAVFGATDQRWATGVGAYSGDTVTINVELTSGGIFNGSNPLATQEPAYGTITIGFINCNEALLTYNFPSVGLTGEMNLTRVVPSNVALCEQLNVVSQVQTGLFIPDGALPDGVTPEDISLSVLRVDPDFYTDQGVEPPLALIQLGPDGLQFSEPLTLTLEVPVEDSTDRQLQVYLVNVEESASGSEPPEHDSELIEGVVSDIDMMTNALIASIPISHFSNVWTVYIEKVFKTEISTSVSESLFGKIFEVETKVTRKVEPGTLLKTLKVAQGEFFYYLGHLTIYTGNDTWSLEGEFKSVKAVLPASVKDRPMLTSNLTQQVFNGAPEEFVCTSSGPASVVYSGTASYYEQYGFNAPNYGILPPKPANKRDERIFKIADLKCIMPKIVATAAPPLTTYTLSPDIPGGAEFFTWSGANCGSVTGSSTSTMIWDHGALDCPHDSTGHPDATITILVTGTFPLSDESYSLNCSFVGAESGEGPDCTVAQ